MARLPLIIDQKSYLVDFSKVDRSAIIKSKVDEETEDGNRYIENIGTYLNYSVVFGIIGDMESYNELYKDLISPTPSIRSITMPMNDEFATVRAKITGVTDSVKHTLASGTKFRALKCVFESTEPTIIA